MPGHGSTPRTLGGLLLAAAALSPLVLSPTAAASATDPSTASSPPTHAAAWGANLFHGQLGVGDPDIRRIAQPTTVEAIGAEFQQVSAGGRHSLAVAADRTVYAWGANEEGQLGVAPGLPDPTPTRVPGLSEVTKIAAGPLHNLALRADGTVWAWGDNQSGQLGDGTRTDRHAPAQVPGLTGVVAIAAGGSHNLALRADRTVWAWGRNDRGQLGDGTWTDRLSPVAVPSLTDVVSVAAGASHSVALRSFAHPALNTVHTWGSNDDGQLGVGDTAIGNRPTQVWGLRGGATAVAAGEGHTLARTWTGTVWAWGRNDRGQLGDGTPHERHFPVMIAGLAGVSSVAAGSDHSVALGQDGSVWAWGANDWGQLGTGGLTEHRTPVETWLLSGATQISAGRQFTLAVWPISPPQFFVALIQSGTTLTAGSSQQFPVIVWPNAGPVRRLALSVTGLPAGVTATIDQAKLLTDSSATLTLSSTELARLGPATLTITARTTPGTPYPATSSAAFALNVAEPADPGCAAADDTDVAIPDTGAATSLMVIPGCDQPDLTTSAVEVHVVHPRRGDLAIDLVDPDGRSIRLKNSNPTDTRPNVNARFQVQVNQDLADRLDDSQWRLRIEDTATGTVGHLNGWSLYL